jgi:hypothetical protein
VASVGTGAIVLAVCGSLVAFGTNAQAAVTSVGLGSAGSFAVLAGGGITNTGPSTVTGNIGTFPTTTITGAASLTLHGTNHAGDSVTQGAKTDLVTAYNTAAGEGPTTAIAADLAGMTLKPGVYNSASAIGLSGVLTLNAAGNPNAVWVFQAGSTLITGSGSKVALVNGAKSCNVFWQVGSSATLGTTTTFAGNILALASITLNTGASIAGRALARNGAVTMAGNNVAVCAGAPVTCPSVTVNPPTLPNGIVGTAYNQTVVASGGTAPYTYALSSGALPTGLSLNPATGAITGTPTTFGTFNFTITATDSNGCPGSRAYSLVIAAVACPAITLNPTTLPPGSIGTAYSQTVIASGGTAPYTYSLSGTLPNGLSLNPVTGAITGTPTATGIFNFTITATDNTGCPGNRPYVIVISAVICPAITLSPTTLPNAVVGIPYNQTVIASGGTAPYAYSLSGTLPNGLSLNPVTGAITGTPTATGTFNFTITATDNAGCPGNRPYVIVISAVICPAITLSPTTLPNAVVGIPYNQTVSASGGIAPYAYSVSSGALPNGLSLNAVTGAITGTPTTVGTFNFTITATDANGCPGARAYVMTATIAIIDTTTPNIPTLSEWGLIILMVLTGLVAIYYVRRI